MLAALAACSDRPKAPERPRPLYSPLGEYLGVPEAGACDGLVERWLARVDTDRDGRLAPAELRSDAERLFARFDADRDGYVTPRELDAARRAMGVPAPAERPLPEPSSGGPIFSVPGGPGGGGARREGATPRDRPLRGPGIDTSPDAVMAADTNLDFRVSREEFLLHADRRFQMLDRAGSGSLGKAEIAALCPRPER